ncbi:MAG TPA: nuclease-related domain-containing protein [Anaerolineales bacterium]
MLIDLFSSDLVAGYKEIRIARQALLKKWRFELLRAYTQKWDRYTQQLAQQEARKARYQRFLPFIGLVLFVICSIGAWLTLRSVDLACLGMILTLGTGFGALIAMAVWMGFSRIPTPPENPVTRTSNDEDESPLRQKLFPKLLPLWRREMAIPIPSVQEVDRLAEETGKWGLIGEFDLIREQEWVASPDTYILHSLKPKSGDDMDVVVIGPKGFWYFEVKHWNADFVWRDGVWQVWQFDHTTQDFQPVPMQEYPDAQWARMRDEALINLRATGGSAGDLLKKLPVLGNIQGGIVFSNPNANIDIDRSAPFRYGTIEQWVAAYQAAPRLKDMSPGRTLQLLEILLKRHQAFYPNTELHSMKSAVAKVIAEVEAGIQQWMDSP